MIMMLDAKGLISEKPCMLLVNTVISSGAIVFEIFRD